MLRENINNYVKMKQAMGFKYRTPNYLLQLFATFAEQRGDTIVRSQTVLEWAGTAPSSAQKRCRLLTVRRFAISMQCEDDRYEIPPPAAFGNEIGKRKIRHLFSPQDIKRMLTATSQLKPIDSLRPYTYTTFFALLAATGLRSSEAMALNIEDFTPGGLIINCSKFRKDRLVSLHKSTQNALQNYLTQRIKYGSLESAFFVSNQGTRLCYSTVNSIFLKIMRSIGLRGNPGEPGPCLNDLRHGFAVKSLEQCSSNRGDIARHMTALSTYLGHAHISDTYWYLQATPILLTQISSAQEAYYKREI